MVTQLVRAEQHHISELGRICFEAFKDIQDRHYCALDFPTIAIARQSIGMLVYPQLSDFLLTSTKTVGATKSLPQFDLASHLSSENARDASPAISYPAFSAME